MNDETYEALKALMTYLGCQGIDSENVGILDAKKQVEGWIDETAKDAEMVRQELIMALDWFDKQAEEATGEAEYNKTRNENYELLLDAINKIEGGE